MSELINNAAKRKELLKHMILQLHKGEAPEQVRARLEELLGSIPYGEVVEVEQELIAEGLPQEEVLQFCDIHTRVLDGKIDHSGVALVPPGHPVDTFSKENRELLALTRQVRQIVEEVNGSAAMEVSSTILRLRALFNALWDVDKHYRRKENLLFPFLEQKGITGPPTVMWGKHDQAREMLKGAREALESHGGMTREEVAATAELLLLPAIQAVEDMTMKEEDILFPMCMDQLTDLEWFSIYEQTPEIGFCLYDPTVEWKPRSIEERPEATVEQGAVRMPSGALTPAELTAILNTMPFDITFVDKDDKVKYFSQGSERIFDRNRAILGRDVRLCHPPSSVHIVDRIIEDFRSGKESSAPFWIQMHGKFIHIEYFALRDATGAYLGTLEVSQDLTAKRALDGEQRLLQYAAKEA
ncbi:MAG TPA: DUF438 domain-containing protein [Bacteroidota bacterium]|nr:DUF438 domain-containing protein [Bacteroidota bacterium]